MKKINKASYITLFLMLCISIFTSCDSARVFEENKDIPEEGWDVKNKIKFDVDIKDPSIPTNFYINVRNADGYPYNDLFLFIKTTFPNGKMSNDTFECTLADENGKWLGKGIGDIYDNQIPFKRNVRFPEAGKYSFEIEQGMRMEVIPLILDVGLRIEKAE